MPQPDIFHESNAYELFMGRWSRRLARLFLDFVSLAPHDRVLDMGCGTGALAIAAAEHTSSARVTGVDRAAAYVRYARSRAQGHRATFLVGDGQALGVRDGVVDKALSLLNLNFIPDREKALRELIRVTRPGGVVAAAVWDYDEGMEMLRVFWDEAVALDPAIAARDERSMPLCRRGELTALWRAHALAAVEEQPIVFELPFASVDDYWMPFLGGQGPAGAYAASLSEADRGALTSRLRRRLLGERYDGAFTLRARAWAVKGSR